MIAPSALYTDDPVAPVAPQSLTDLEAAALIEWQAEYGDMDGFDNDCFSSCDRCGTSFFVGSRAEHARRSFARCERYDDWTCFACDEGGVYRRGSAEHADAVLEGSI